MERVNKIVPRSRRRTTDQYKEELKAKNPNLEVLEEYINAKTPILHLNHECGHQYRVAPYHALNGVGCKECYYIRSANAKRKSQIQFVDEVKAVNPNILIIGNYINSKTKILSQCLICGYEWDANPYVLLRGGGCPNCVGNRKYTHDEFVELLKTVNSNLTVTGEYRSMNQKIKVRCNICGYEWMSKASHLFNGHGCPKCVGFYKTHDEFMSEASKRKNKKIKILGNYVNSHTEIDVMCLTCGRKWGMLPYGILNGNGCKVCSVKNNGINLRKTMDDFIKDVYDIHGDSIQIKGLYVNAKQRVKCKCSICGHEWNPIAESLLAGYGCPNCKKSWGEIRIEKYCIKNNIAYTRTQKYDGLYGVGGRNLSYDFYLPLYNLLIEFQGEQHIHSKEHFGGEKQLKKQQEHDRRKREYAKTHNINLLEIWYYDIDKVDQILDEYLNNLKSEPLTTAG